MLLVRHLVMAVEGNTLLIPIFSFLLQVGEQIK